MRALRRAAWLIALAAYAAAEPVAETPLPQSASAVASPLSVAQALRGQLGEMSPVAGSARALAQALEARLADPAASPAQTLACRYLASAVASPTQARLVREFVRRSGEADAAGLDRALASFTAPYINDPQMRRAFARAATSGALDPAQLKLSLDRLFEKSSGARAAAADGVLAASKPAGPQPADIPRLGPTIRDLSAQGASMRAGAFHENDRAKVVVMHEPGPELLFANHHPDSALFTGPVDWKKATAEHARYRAALEAEGAQVFLVRDVLLAGTLDENGDARPGPELDALRALAGRFLHYDTRPLVREYRRALRRAEKSPEGPARTRMLARLDEIREKISPEGQKRYGREVLEKMTPDNLVETILTQPMIELHLQVRRNSGEAYVGLSQEVRLKPLANLFFARDQQITTHKGVVINKMSFTQREAEPAIMKFVFEKLGVPIVAELKDGPMDGGDYLPAGDLVFQGVGLRTTQSAVDQLLREDAYGAKEIAVVRDEHDQHMDRMHLDTVFNVLADDKVLALDDIFKDPKKRRVVDLYRRADKKGPLGFYRKVEQDMDFEAFLRRRGFQVATVSHEEQLRYALNFLNVGNSRVLTPYGDKHYLEKLRSLGVDAQYVPMKCLTDGYGAAHCMTQVISREPRH